tara:strand:- start:1668 stop:2591 length:924 start_codon:yes stop_codon:yes gene_type:complete
MIRAPSGLLDFRHCLVDDWSPVRSHAAYHNFLDLVEKMGRAPSYFNFLEMLKSSGQRYDDRFNGQFRSLSRIFADQFLVATYKAEWGLDGLRENGFVRWGKHLARRLGFRRAMLNEVCLMDGQDFDLHAKAYLTKLYETFIPAAYDHVVFNNGFESFNPGPGLDMLGARQIVVTRDPRDVYVSGLNRHNVNEDDKTLRAFDNDGLSKSFLATDDLDVFVKRYRLYQERSFTNLRADVLHLKFENLILDYDSQIKTILEFLGLGAERHVRPESSFSPSDSKKNIGLWRDYSRKDEIRFIESELSDYLF